MRLTDLQRIVCVGCGRGDRTLRKLPNAMNPNLRACDPCLATYGRAALEIEADQVLADARPGRLVGAGKCLHCGRPVVALPTGGFPAWCVECERERQKIMTGL